MNEKEISRYIPFQWDGCGCVWYEKGKRKILIKCDLHEKNPRAFGGILMTLKVDGEKG